MLGKSQTNGRLNELGIEFLAGYFLGVGLLQTPTMQPEMDSNAFIRLSLDPTLTFATKEKRWIKHVSYLFQTPYFQDSNQPMYYQVQIHGKARIQFILEEILATLTAIYVLDNQYVIEEEFPELLEALKVVKSLDD